MKVLSRTDTPLIIVFYSSVYFTFLASIPAAYYWANPSVEQLGLLICVGILTSIAKLCVTEALKVAETTAIMPIDFTRLIWAAALGYIWFGEFPDFLTWIGETIVFASTVYITYRGNRAASIFPNKSIANGFTQ